MGVKIPIGKNRFLVSDEFQYWIVQECKLKTKGETYHKRLSGYSTELDHAINSYNDRHIRTSDIETIQELAQKIKKLRADNKKLWEQFKGEGKDGRT